MSRKTTTLFFILAIFAFLLGGVMVKPAEAAFTNFTINSTSARSSFRGALAPGNTADSSVAIIQTTQGPNVYSTSSMQLIPSDLLQIGENYYYVATNSVITDAAHIPLDRPLDSVDITAGTDVLMRVVNNISFGFVTSQAAPNGYLEALVPAATTSAQTSDNFPDAGGFDFGMSSVTCPASIPGVFDFSTPIATPAANTTSETYHTYICPYTGTGAAGTDFTNNPMIIKGVLNPAPSENHVEGQVDMTQIMFRAYDENGTVTDSSVSQLGFFEPVKMTVEVAPQITFQINGVAASTNACGVPTDVATQPREVPFEDISPTYFKNAAQKFSITTNAAHGYTVTAIADDQMGLNGGACAGADATGNPNCIPDVTAGGATPTTAGLWNDPTAQKGFGFSLQNLTTGTNNPTVFDYTTGYRQFADRTVPEQPVPILRNTSSTNNDEAYVCYRIVPPSDTTPGEYSSNIMYTITATF